MSPAKSRWLATAALAVIGIVAVIVFVTVPARAQTGRTAVCVDRGSIMQPSPGAGDVEIWMNQQIASGKSQFIVVDRDSALCAW